MLAPVRCEIPDKVSPSAMTIVGQSVRGVQAAPLTGGAVAPGFSPKPALPPTLVVGSDGLVVGAATFVGARVGTAPRLQANPTNNIEIRTAIGISRDRIIPISYT
jgi:hypothetical protein